jgi:fermentation-respiration switch protein FrsA (DUF1100 family)
MRKTTGIAIVFLIAFGFVYTAFDSFVDALVEGVLFQPTPGSDPSRGIDTEDVYLTSDDGVRIHALYLPGAPAPSRAVLFLHGNAGNASHRLSNAVELTRLDCAVLVLDYRGYGLSDGQPSEAGVYRDARAGFAHLVDRGFPSRAIIVLGRSLGGAVAVDLAQDRDLGGVILESTFTSVADVAAEIGGPILSFVVGNRFESIAKISRVRAPLLFFHGDRDEVIDYSLGRRLFGAAGEPKTFETIRGAGHNDTVMIGGRAYFERIRRFIDAAVPG